MLDSTLRTFRKIKYWALETLHLRGKINFKKAFNPQERELILSAIHNRKQKLAYFTNKGIRFDTKGHLDISPLFWLIRHEEWKALNFALKLGANPNLSAHGQNVPLEIFIMQNNLKMVKLFLEYGADPNIENENKQPLFFDAIIDNNWPMLELLIEHGANIHQTSQAGENSALYAASLRNFKMVCYFINLGANYEVVSKNGMSIYSHIEEIFEDKLLPPNEDDFSYMIHVKTFIENKKNDNA